MIMIIRVFVAYIQARRRRAAAIARWTERRDTIRASRLRSTPRQGDIQFGYHGALCPWHCVCNGTHPTRGFCPRCEWARASDSLGDC